MAEEELQIEEGSGKKKIIIISVIVVLLLGGGAAAYFFLFSSGDEQMDENGQVMLPDGTMAPASSMPIATGSAMYVAMPRPFVFTIPGTGKDRLVEIRVQLLVRGSENEETAKTHIPLIEGTLLQAFSASNADDLISDIGKAELREVSAEAVQKSMIEIVGRPVVERVLFTGFVMQ